MQYIFCCCYMCCIKLHPISMPITNYSDSDSESFDVCIEHKSKINVNKIPEDLRGPTKSPPIPQIIESKHRLVSKIKEEPILKSNTQIYTILYSHAHRQLHTHIHTYN